MALYARDKDTPALYRAITSLILRRPTARRTGAFRLLASSFEGDVALRRCRRRHL